jgi:hypothetical protein
MRQLVLLGLCSFVLGGCFSPKYGNGDLRCENGTTCPDGYHCASDSTCWKNGQDPADAADMSSSMDNGDMGQPPVLTYPPAAVWTSGGGGSVTAASGNQLNFSLSPSSAGGTAVSPNNSTLTLGFFSNDIY